MLDAGLLYFNHKITIKSTKILRGNSGHIGSIKHSFTSACRKAGIGGFRFRALRHTYARRLAMRGVHIRALQELLGHKTLAITQRYSHLAPEKVQNSVKLPDGVIGEGRELIERLRGRSGKVTLVTASPQLSNGFFDRSDGNLPCHAAAATIP
jgi:hypothetical protein